MSTIQWLGTPKEKVAPRAAPPVLDLFGHLGAFGLGAPPGCPGGTTVTPDYNTCRSQTQQAAQGKCEAAAQQIAAGQGTWAQLGYSSKADCIEKSWSEFYWAAGCTNLCGPEVFPPCASATIIKSVQEDLGRPQTGVWTTADEDALPAGYSFASFAPDCEGAAPIPIDASGGGGGQPKPPPPPTTSSSSGSPWGMILLAAAAAAALYIGMQ